MSMQDQEKKNFKVARIIIVIAWIAIHAIALGLSNNRFGPVSAHGWLWILPIASVIYTVWLVAFTGTDTLSENNGYYIAGVILAFFSAMAVAYCPFC